MFCGEIISNFEEDSEYDDKSLRQYIMNGQRSNHSKLLIKDKENRWVAGIRIRINYVCAST